MEAGIIILFIFLCLFLVVAIIASTIFKNFIAKKNALYLIPLVIITTILYSLGYKEQFNTYDISSFIICLNASIKALTFEIKKELFENLANSNLLYAITIYSSIILSGITMISALLGFIKVFLINAFKLFLRIFRKETVFIIGINKYSIEFAKRTKNSVILVDKINETAKLTTDFKKNLYSNNIVYLRLKIRAKKLSKYIMFCKNNIQFFCFDATAEALNSTLILVKEITVAKNKRVNFHLMSDEENILFVNKQLTEARSLSNNQEQIIASAFNIYQILGDNFSKCYNFAQFLPRSFFNDGTILKDKNIDVVMLGIGKCMNSILTSTILNNQFVTLENDKYTLKPITYHLFDINDSAFSKKIIRLFKKENIPFKMPAIIKKRKLDLRGGIDLDTLLDDDGQVPTPNENSFVFYFVNIGESLDNLCLVNSIIEHVSNPNCVVFYCVDSKNEVVNITSNNKILPFGYKNDLLTLDYLANKTSIDRASDIHKEYLKLKKGNQSFGTLNIIEKLSNKLAEMNLEFKLNTLGFTLKKGNGLPVDINEFYSVYLKGEKQPTTYDDYFKITPRNAMRFQEHARWNVYYYMNNFKVMKFSDVKLNKENKIVQKNLSLMQHACLIPFYELDNLFKYEANLLTKAKCISFLEALNTVEAYKYDSLAIDNIACSKENKMYKFN